MYRGYSRSCSIDLFLTCCTEEHFNNISCWCGRVMAAPVSRHHSVTHFSIVVIPATVHIFHPRGGGNSFVASLGIYYTWVTRASTYNLLNYVAIFRVHYPTRDLLRSLYTIPYMIYHTKAGNHPITFHLSIL